MSLMGGRRASDILPLMKDLGRRRAHVSTPPPASGPPAEPRSSRTTDSVDEGSSSRPTGPEPLLTLLLTKQSFLDTVVSDGANALYNIATKSTKTSVRRTQMLAGLEIMCTIRWCSDPLPIFRDISPSGVHIQMGRSKTTTAEDFLKFVSVFTTRKFKIPDYRHSLKWKRVGDAFQLSSSGVRGTIAILDPSIMYAPPRIRIFHRLFDDKWDLPEYRGVPVVLMDYILATSILLAVDPDEWTRLSGGTTSRSSVKHKSASPSSPVSIQDWQRSVVREVTDISSTPERPERPEPSTNSLHPLRTSPLRDEQLHAVSPSSGTASASTDYPQTPRSAFSHPYSSSYGHSGSSQESSDDTMSLYQSLSLGMSVDELRILSRTVSISRSSEAETVHTAPLLRSTPTSIAPRSTSVGGRPRRSLPPTPGQPPGVPPVPLVPPNLSHLVPPQPRMPPPQPPSMPMQTSGHARVLSEPRNSEPRKIPEAPPLPVKVADDRYNYGQREAFYPGSLPGPSGAPVLQAPQPPFRHHRHLLSNSSFDLREVQARHALENLNLDAAGDRQTVYELPPPSYDSINWATQQSRQSGQNYVV